MEAMGAALRLELAPFEISVSSVNPGSVHTEIADKFNQDMADSLRLTDPAQVRVVVVLS